MNKIIRIKQSRFKSIIGFTAGLIFCIIGLTIVIPRTQGFGVVWTLFAVLITITQGISAFSEKGIASHTLEVETVDGQETEGDTLVETVETEDEIESEDIEYRLLKLKDLFEKNLINEEEYHLKKEEILKKL